jgi:hypothetical protein
MTQQSRDLMASHIRTKYWIRDTGWYDNCRATPAADADGRTTEVRLVAGALGDRRPPPRSWAARPDATSPSDHPPVARWTLPPAPPGDEPRP